MSKANDLMMKVNNADRLAVLDCTLAILLLAEALCGKKIKKAH